VFPSGASNLVNVNDLAPGTALVDIIDNLAGVTVSGNSLVVTGSIQGNANLGIAIDIQAHTVTLTGFPRLLGTLSGSGVIAGSRLTIVGGVHPFSGTITAAVTLNGATLP